MLCEAQMRNENEIKFETTKKWCTKWENYINVI